MFRKNLFVLNAYLILALELLKRVAENKGRQSCSQEGENGTLSFSPAPHYRMCIFAWRHWAGHSWNCRSFLAWLFQKAPTPCSCWHLSRCNRAASLWAYLICTGICFNDLSKATSQRAALFILRWWEWHRCRRDCSMGEQNGGLKEPSCVSLESPSDQRCCDWTSHTKALFKYWALALTGNIWSLSLRSIARL